MARLSIGSQDFNDAKAHIYGLAHNVCVNGEEQTKLLRAIQLIEKEAISDSCSGQQIIKLMMFPIMDGIVYGNWPWSEQLFSRQTVQEKFEKLTKMVEQSKSQEKRLEAQGAADPQKRRT